MPRRKMIRALCSALAFFALCAGCARGSEGSGEPTTLFTIASASQSATLLQLTQRCGDCERTLTYTLTTDGKLVRIWDDPPDAPRRTEKMLSSARVQQLIALVVDRGVMTSSKEKIRDALRARGGEKLIADGGETWLEVHLATLQQGGRQSVNPSVRIGVRSLGAQYHAYKDIPEINAMQLLLQELKKEIG
jgi:hypothetical protein